MQGLGGNLPYTLNVDKIISSSIINFYPSVINYTYISIICYQVSTSMLQTKWTPDERINMADPRCSVLDRSNKNRQCAWPKDKKTIG